MHELLGLCFINRSGFKATEIGRESSSVDNMQHLGKAQQRAMSTLSHCKLHAENCIKLFMQSLNAGCCLIVVGLCM